MRKRTRMMLIAGTAGMSAAAAMAAVAAETLTYRYDARGRLVKVERSGGPSNGVVTTHVYDKANNRTAKNVSGAP